ncbi:MAG: hypothetical protein QM765_47295 [Myxococcales bacterium]
MAALAQLGPGEELWAHAVRAAVVGSDDEALAILTGTDARLERKAA